jgi:hypothetical protein
MGNAKPTVADGPGRTCLCCGIAAASRDIPACWEHWILLPEDLRSALVISQGRGQLSVYTANLLEAVRVWRLKAAWRPRTKKAPMPVAAAAAETLPSPTALGKVISLFDRRQKSAGPTPNRPGAGVGKRLAKSPPLAAGNP